MDCRLSVMVSTACHRTHSLYSDHLLPPLLQSRSTATTRFCYSPYFRPGFWVRSGSRAFVRISSRTLDRHVAVTNLPRTTPMPFQRVSTDFCGSPDHPRRAETAERATWGTKTPPRPPTAGTPPAPARVRRKPRRWDPLVPICICGGGAPRWPRPGRRRPEPRALLCGNAQGPLEGRPSARPVAIEVLASGLPARTSSGSYPHPLSAFRRRGGGCRKRGR